MGQEDWDRDQRIFSRGRRSVYGGLSEGQARAVDEVVRELVRAVSLFQPMTSPHEGWAIVKEEEEELKKLVFTGAGRTPEAFTEAMQLGAMAIRYIGDLS